MASRLPITGPDTAKLPTIHAMGERGVMRHSPATEAMLSAIKGDVRTRVDTIVDDAEGVVMGLSNEAEIEAVLDGALVAVEKALTEAAEAMAREILLDYQKKLH